MVLPKEGAVFQLAQGRAVNGKGQLEAAVVLGYVTANHITEELGGEGGFDVFLHGSSGDLLSAPGRSLRQEPALEFLQRLDGLVEVHREPLDLADEEVFTVSHDHGTLDTEHRSGGPVGPDAGTARIVHRSELVCSALCAETHEVTTARCAGLPRPRLPNLALRDLSRRQSASNSAAEVRTAARVQVSPQSTMPVYSPAGRRGD